MEHLGFIFFFISQILLGNLLNFMISMNFQQLKKNKFRGFSTHFSITKNGKGTGMILRNFSKNAVIFKTSYIYQNTNVCT